MSNIFVNDWTAFAEECHQLEKQQNKVKAQQVPMPTFRNTLPKNEYPTLTAEEFAKLSLARVDTLLNNMRVTSGRGG